MIMDCEQKYKEALERAKKFKEHLLEINNKGYAEEMDYIFPELKESEDERIRKALFEYFTTSDNNAYYEVCGVATKKILAWLEKQGEQKYSEWSKADKEYRDAAIYYLRSFCNPYKVEPILEWLESLESKVLPQPQPQWSEEDERNLQGIIDEINANKNNAPDYDLATYDRFLSWLKSLKEKMKGE